MATCHFCQHEITAEPVCWHHVQPKADGGDPDGLQVPCHRGCHNEYHRENGDFSRWKELDYAAKVRLFGQAEVTRLLSYWGRKGWQAWLEKRTPEQQQEFHRAGGQTAPMRGRDNRGRFLPKGAANGQAVTD